MAYLVAQSVGAVLELIANIYMGFASDRDYMPFTIT